jgi:hypothetical protein
MPLYHEQRHLIEDVAFSSSNRGNLINLKVVNCKQSVMLSASSFIFIVADIPIGAGNLVEPHENEHHQREGYKYI